MQLKREVERAWESEKDRDSVPQPRSRPAHGSTKRVEQFRKNMRRWMIGEIPGLWPHLWRVHAVGLGPKAASLKNGQGVRGTSSEDRLPLESLLHGGPKLVQDQQARMLHCALNSKQL